MVFGIAPLNTKHIHNTEMNLSMCTKNGRFGGWPPALWAKVIICYVYTYKYGTNRTSECYSIPAFYYTEKISLISKYFNSKCPVVNTPAAILSQQKWRPKLGILR